MKRDMNEGVRRFGLLVGFAAMAACSSGGSDGGGAPVGGNPSVDLGMAVPDLAMPKPYPASPYGVAENQTLADFTASGYRLSPGHTDATQLPWAEDIKLSEFYYNAACKCMLITIGATWCTACQQEQPAVIADVEGDPNFCVLGVLQEGLTGATATQSDVEEWTAEYSQNFPVIQGNTKTNRLLSGTGSGTIGLPYSLIVDPATMKVLQIVEGFDPQIHEHAQALCPSY